MHAMCKAYLRPRWIYYTQHECASDDEVMSPPKIKTTWRGGMGFKSWAGKADAVVSAEKNSSTESEMKKDFKARQPHACQD